MEKFQFERHIPKEDGTVEIIVLTQNLSKKDAEKAAKRMKNYTTNNGHTFHITPQK